MNEQKLNDILEEYAIAAPIGNDLAALRKLTEQYPEYAAELEDFAAARAVLRYAPEAELSAEEEAQSQSIGLQNLRSLLGDKNSAAQEALQSLTETARAKGLNRSKFAGAVGLSVSLVQYLEKRRLAFKTIPGEVIARVAQVLEVGEELVRSYLDQAPTYAAQTSFKTNERAEEMPPKSFSEAVREDQQLSAQEKNELLKLK